MSLGMVVKPTPPTTTFWQHLGMNIDYGGAWLLNTIQDNGP